jgi:hypothetical protein
LKKELYILQIFAGIQQYRRNHFGRLWGIALMARRNKNGAFHA